MKPNIIITNKLSRELINSNYVYTFISTRDLLSSELNVAKDNNINRYLLKQLNEFDKKEFFKKLDIFWNELITRFDKQHPFWRNAVSTKMQQWEKSPIYLMLILYSLFKSYRINPCSKLIFICKNIEEYAVCVNWSKKNNWLITDNYFVGIPHNFVKGLQLIKYIFSFWTVSTKLILMIISTKNTNLFNGKNNRKILISTAFYPNNIANSKYIDPFFGNLGELFKKENYEVHYVARPLMKFRTARAKSQLIDSFFILHSVVTFIDLVKLIFRLFFPKLRINRLIFENCDFSKYIEWSYKYDCIDQNFESELVYLAIKNLCKANTYERLLHLYEGNNTDNASVQAFREYSKGKILGYSHGVVFPINLKLFKSSLENNYSPVSDLLVSSGKEITNLLSHYFGIYNQDSIITGCSFREIPKTKYFIQDSRLYNGTILVGLDGVWSSVNLLDWLFNNYHNLNLEYNIILRGHPNLPVKLLLKKTINNLPENISISSNTLEYDLCHCFCVLYRHSSVGLQSIINGLPAIHLNIDLPINGDPISNYMNANYVVNDVNELNLALLKIKTLTQSELYSLKLKSIEYSNTYFTPPNRKSHKMFLS